MTAKPARRKKKRAPATAVKLTSARAMKIHQAALAWREGDVYSAWNTIGKVCRAPWVAEVLDALELDEPVETETTLDFSEEIDPDRRARQIRQAVDKRVAADASDSDTIPPLNSSLRALKSFLAKAPADEAIAWLRESARHTLEAQQQSTGQALRVALLGEFSSGKTRLINALLGEKILSTGIVPVTRSVTRIVHGTEISVTVRHVDGSEMDVPVDQLKFYTDERKKKKGSSEVDEVILRHPSPLLKKVELWDTPGFNSDNQLHDQVAAQLLLEADAVLWILSPHQVGTRSEGKLLETVRRAQGKVVAVLNQTDRLDDDKAITKQVAAAKEHYAKTVEEVVPTSAKWLEEGHAGGNRAQLMSHIEAIGAWSQEQRNRRVARRVAAVAAQGKAYLSLTKEQASKDEKKKKQQAKQLEKQRQQVLGLWKEALDHMERHHQVTADAEDRWFQAHCADQRPLTDAYRTLLTEDLKLVDFRALYQCLATLEETHWHLSPNDPTPWRKDFLLCWKRGRSSRTNNGKPGKQDGEQFVFEAKDLLVTLSKITLKPRIIRWAGSTDRVAEIVNTVNAESAASRSLKRGVQTLDDSVLQKRWRKSEIQFLKNPILSSRDNALVAPFRRFSKYFEFLDDLKTLHGEHAPQVRKLNDLKKKLTLAEKAYNKAKKKHESLRTKEKKYRGVARECRIDFVSISNELEKISAKIKPVKPWSSDETSGWIGELDGMIEIAQDVAVICANGDPLQEGELFTKYERLEKQLRSSPLINSNLPRLSFPQLSKTVVGEQRPEETEMNIGWMGPVVGEQRTEDAEMNIGWLGPVIATVIALFLLGPWGIGLVIASIWISGAKGVFLQVTGSNYRWLGPVIAGGVGLSLLGPWGMAIFMTPFCSSIPKNLFRIAETLFRDALFIWRRRDAYLQECKKLQMFLNGGDGTISSFSKNGLIPQIESLTAQISREQSSKMRSQTTKKKNQKKHLENTIDLKRSLKGLDAQRRELENRLRQELGLPLQKIINADSAWPEYELPEPESLAALQEELGTAQEEVQSVVLQFNQGLIELKEKHGV